MYSKALIALAASLAIPTTPIQAMPIGQPLLVAEADLSGSLLDFFDFFGPSGLKILSASGTITSTFGADTLIGETINLNIGVGGGMINETVQVAGADLVSGFAIGGGRGSLLEGSGLTDEGATGVFSFTHVANPAFSATFDAGPPATVTFDYDDPFSFYGPRTMEDALARPEFEIGVNVFFDGIFPTKIFEETDGAGNVVNTFDYIEGPINVTRIEIGLIGGDPISQVPVPATLPLMLLGVSGLALMRRKRAA